MYGTFSIFDSSNNHSFLQRDIFVTFSYDIKNSPKLINIKYISFQIGCLFVEYDLFNTTTFIQNLIYIRFGIILTQFYINFSRQEHEINVLYVLPSLIFPLKTQFSILWLNLVNLS